MFISLSKTIGKVGGFRIGIGKRITSKNAWWMCLIICCVAIFQLMWYMMVLTFWLMYAMFYGMWWCCKKLFQAISGAIKAGKAAKSNYVDAPASNNYVKPQITAEDITSGRALTPKYCPNCGEEIKEGNAFCIKCGTEV